jgi:hypothetical protein
MSHEPTSVFLMFANPAVTTALSLSNTLAGVAPTTRRAFIAAQCAGTLERFRIRWNRERFHLIGNSRFDGRLQRHYRSG